MMFHVAKKSWDFVDGDGNYTDVTADVDEDVVTIGEMNWVGQFNATDLRHFADSLKVSADWLEAETNRRNGVGVLDED
jgi:high-affinity K+ transport system ATPase subunit B